MIGNQTILYREVEVEQNFFRQSKIKSSEPEVKTECFEFGSVVTQTWNEEQNTIHNEEYQNSSDDEDTEPSRKRRKSCKRIGAIPNTEAENEQSLQQMVLDLRQQNERILRQLTPIQSTVQKTCQNVTSLLVLRQLKQSHNEVDSIATSYIPPPPIGNVEDFDSFESFLVQNSHAPSKDSTSSVNNLVSKNVVNRASLTSNF